MRRILPFLLFFLALVSISHLNANPQGENHYTCPVEDAPLNPDIVYQLPAEEMLPEGVAFISKQTADWSHETLNIPAAHKIGKGKGAKIAILDTGIDANHPEFRGRILAAKNFTTSRSGASDVNGHGTHCAGIAAAGDDGEGTIGIAPEAQIVVGKVLGDGGSGLTSWIAAAIVWAVDDQAVDVISLSLGSSSPDARLRDAIQYATSKGVVVVAAAGNEGPRDGTVGYPGAYPETICVGSIGQSSVVSRFSSRGPEVFLAAPGEQILATYPGGRFARLSGTSMATPAVAGLVAVIQGHLKSTGRPRLTPEEMKKLLITTILDLDPNGRDRATGYGMPQLFRALVALPDPKPPVDPPTPPTPPVDPPLPPVGGSVLIKLEDLSPAKQKEVLARWPNFKYFEIRNKIEVIVHAEEK